MKKIFLILFSICCISSCALYKKPEVPLLNSPEKFKVTVKASPIILNEKWWENFHDDNLNYLVELAIKNNYSYQVTLKNIDIAHTYVMQNVSNLFPQINANFNSTRNKSAAAILGQFNGTVPVNPNSASFGRIFNLQQLTGTVSYEVDIWNQIRNSIKQAQADEATNIANSHVVKLTLISAVVDTYFQLITLTNNLSNLQEQYKLATEIIHLTNTQFSSGLIDATQVDTAKNQAEVIKSNLQNLTKQKQLLEYTLAYLLSEYPENFDIKINLTFNFLTLQNLIPPDLPSQMLANRPDIQSTFYQILSFGYLEKQNIANFLPTINLTGNYGYASTALSNLLIKQNAYWNYGAYLSQFIFDYQTRMSIYLRSKYQYEAAILNYRNTVINAFKEVDSALSSYQEDSKTLDSYKTQVFNTQDLAAIYHAQYQAGLIDYSIYLTARLDYLQKEYDWSNQQLIVAQDIIQTYKTLGLGL